ncbi:MAG: hypothetical protein ACKOAY_08785 [Haliscomenobacter sp.]
MHRVNLFGIRIRNKPVLNRSGTLCLLFAIAGLPAYAQSLSDFSITGKSIPALRREEMTAKTEPLALLSPRLYSPIIASASQSQLAVGRYHAAMASRAFDPKDLAFFCRIEFKLEKKVRFPIKVRLGEVQYVEQLEGKY